MSAILANVAIPSGAVFGVYPLLALLPVVLIEWIVYRIMCGPTVWKWLKLVFAANVLSSIVGIPISFLLITFTDLYWTENLPVLITIPFYLLSVWIEHGVINSMIAKTDAPTPRVRVAWFANGLSYAALLTAWLMLVGIR